MTVLHNLCASRLRQGMYVTQHRPSGASTGRREWFDLPELSDMIRLIETSGAASHRLQEHWHTSIGAFCRSTDPYGRRWFCNPDASPVFNQEVSGRGTLDMGP